MHDLLGIGVFLMAFTAIIFFAPEFGGCFPRVQQLHPGRPVQDPPHIAPVWYFTPFYSMLRAITTRWSMC